MLFIAQKLVELVEFPVQGLNMASYIVNSQPTDAVYDLIGICKHDEVDSKFNSFHCKYNPMFLILSIKDLIYSITPTIDTAYAKNKDDRLWYHFDDHDVNEITQD